MPDIDPSIALSFKQADPMKSLSSMLTTANDALTYKRNQATYDADVQQKQATASSAGSKATVDAANVNPLIGQQAAQTSSAQTKADSDKFGLDKDYANTALQTASGLLSDPAITATGTNYSTEAAAKSITGAVDQMVAKGVPPHQAMQAAAPLFMKMHEEGGVANYLKSTVLGGMAPASQANAIVPSGVAVTNNQESKVINTNPFAAPVGSAIGGTTQPNNLSPAQQHTVGTDVNGNPVDVSRSPQGTFNPPAAMPGSNAPPMISYPSGESVDSKKVLEDESLVAKNAALQGPQIHDINKTIISEASKGFATGKLGALTQDLASRTGYKFSPGEDATSYNMMAKMLARSAAQAAQSMGPHTNAGLQSATEQNGSMEYTPAAITKIAHLNDALQTGVDNYNLGKDAAIKAGGSVFAKRQFDTQWAQNANVDALKLTNALKLGDKAQTDEVINGLGGRSSDKFKSVVKNVQNLATLTNKGSL